jgi:hypothetical protein
MKQEIAGTPIQLILAQECRFFRRCCYVLNASYLFRQAAVRSYLPTAEVLTKKEELVKQGNR